MTRFSPFGKGVSSLLGKKDDAGGKGALRLRRPPERVDAPAQVWYNIHKQTLCRIKRTLFPIPGGDRKTDDTISRCFMIK